MGKQLEYGGAYYFDGQHWKYTHNDKRVPGASVFVNDRTGKFYMNAPELLIHQMLDIRDIAELLDIKVTSVPPMMNRSLMPMPQWRVGNVALWAAPIIEHFKANRPSKDWRRTKI